MAHDNELPPFSRRSFLQVSSAALACHILTEPMLAQVAIERAEYPKGAVRINSNENPLGPCTAAREAITAVLPNSGRYEFPLTEKLVKTFAEQQGLKAEHLVPLAGSTPALNYIAGAFTSPKACYVTAEPGYDVVAHVAQTVGARVVGVPLTKTWSHDVKAMLAAAPDAGVFYVCTPNNPTGTLTSHDDIEYLLEHKPKGSLVVVDEAYIHFCDAPSAIDLVEADKDVVVLRTFSKIYGMAGLRCGFAIARPDLLEKMSAFSGWSAMPITAVAAASASLKDPQLVPDRKHINATIREATFEWLSKNSYSFVPSQSNCFMLDVKRPAKEAIAAMAAQNVFIGRPWPVWPTHVRITVGTQAEMERFQAAFQHVMSGAAAASLSAAPPASFLSLDGLEVPATRA